jgi:hypothetical protein
VPTLLPFSHHHHFISLPLPSHARHDPVARDQHHPSCSRILSFSPSHDPPQSTTVVSLVPSRRTHAGRLAEHPSPPGRTRICVPHHPSPWPAHSTPPSRIASPTTRTTSTTTPSSSRSVGRPEARPMWPQSGRIPRTWATRSPLRWKR